jgi:hypothetical protein
VPQPHDRGIPLTLRLGELREPVPRRLLGRRLQTGRRAFTIAPRCCRPAYRTLLRNRCTTNWWTTVCC